jgi:hypothetical protein
MLDIYLRMLPIVLNFITERNHRQISNNKLVYDAIKNKNTKLIRIHSNEKELDRLLEEFNLTLEKLIEECSESDIAIKLLASKVSIRATRQSKNDETLQLKTCSNIGKVNNIIITQTSMYRATKKGNIITNTEMRTNNINKEDCLKSFDAIISGKLSGFVFAKTVYGKGGHQDNVFIEAETMCEWAKEFNTKNLIVILIDTDLTNKFNALINNYKDISNLLILNSYEFQMYLLGNTS